MKETKTFDFRNKVEQATWSQLVEHHKRGVLFQLSMNYELTQVANEMEADNKEFVQELLEQGDLARPQQVAYEDDQEFNFIIVQPFVLIRQK